MPGMIRAPRSAGHRRALRAAGAVLALVLFAGCAGMLGVDDSSDVSVAFCDLLGRCYEGRPEGECAERVGSALDDTDAARRSAWLRAFADSACLETCTSARVCLDRVPVCADGACALREDCCGFVTGRTDCDTAAGTCCRRKGNGCTSDDDCCPDAGGCSELTGTCGGVICRPPEQPCLNDFECCTNRCDDGVCAATICVDDGFECDEDEDCCNGSCPSETGLCGISGCGDNGVACGEETPCCDGLICFLGVCSVGECYPENGDCVSDSQCCSNFCDPLYYLCGVACKADGEACQLDPECCGGSCADGVCNKACSTGTCVEDADCCSGTCLGNVCKAACAPATCDHSACAVGGPLDGACDGCAAQVCAADPFCCCGAWDSLCVQEAVGLCPNPCDQL
jgi:hypothetical protein